MMQSKIRQKTDARKLAQKPGISLWWDAFSPYKRFISLCGDVFVYKCMCDIFKDCRKTFDEKINRNGSQINY